VEETALTHPADIALAVPSNPTSPLTTTASNPVLGIKTVANA